MFILSDNKEHVEINKTIFLFFFLNGQRIQTENAQKNKIEKDIKVPTSLLIF